MTDLRIRRATGRGQAPAVPVPAPRRPGDPPIADPPSPVPDGIELGRLLRLVGLTPAQAVEVGVGLLAAVAGGSGPDGTCTAVTVGDFVMDGYGRVTLLPGASRVHDRASPAGRSSGVAVAAVLEDVVRAARLRAGRDGPDTDPLLAELDRAVADLPVVGVPAVARMLGEAIAGTDRSAVRAQLGALTRAVGRQSGKASGAEPAPVPAGAVRPKTAARATAVVPRNAGRRIGAWILSILVLAGVVLLENALLRDKVTADVGVLLDAGRGGSTPSAAPKPDGLPVVPPAPAAAGSVLGVDLRPMAECAPAVPCTVRLLVRVVPGAGPQLVTWSYRIVDRCTGTVVPVPGGTASIPAGQERVAVVGTVALPNAPAVGVVAVTGAPAVAASAPVLVGSCRPRTG